MAGYAKFSDHQYSWNQDYTKVPLETFHPASQTEIGSPLAVRMLYYWLLLSLRKLKSNRLAMKGGRFLGVAGGNWGGLGAPQQHRQPLADPPSPDSIDPKISAFYTVTFTSSRSSTVRTLDRRTSWAPCRNNTKASAPSSKRSLRYPPHHPFGSGWHHLQQSHAGAFQGAGSWFSKS